MLKKYLDTRNGEYMIVRESEDKYGFRYDNTNTNNIITLQVIKEAIKALQTLLDIQDYKIIIQGKIGTYCSNQDIEVLKINNSTIEIMDYTEKSPEEKTKVKIKVNEDEAIETYKRDTKTYELIQDENGMLIPYTEHFYNNFIDRVTIQYTI